MYWHLYICVHKSFLYIYYTTIILYCQIFNLGFNIFSHVNFWNKRLLTYHSPQLLRTHVCNMISVWNLGNKKDMKILTIANRFTLYLHIFRSDFMMKDMIHIILWFFIIHIYSLRYTQSLGVMNELSWLSDWSDSSSLPIFKKVSKKLCESLRWYCSYNSRWIILWEDMKLY